MIGALLLAMPAIALLAAGTPRQAEALFHGGFRERGRKACRAVGMSLLAASLSLALAGDDRARHFVGWIGTIGIEALLLAVALTPKTKPPTRN